MIIIGIVLVGAFGFGIFSALNSTNVSEYLPEHNKSSENSKSSEIPLYDGKSAPEEIPPHYGSAPEKIPPYDGKSAPDDSSL